MRRAAGFLCFVMAAGAAGAAPEPAVSSVGGEVLVSDGALEYVKTGPGEGPGGFSAVWRFADWEKDAWVFMPACAYGGNREWTGIPLGEPAYPPGPSPEGFGPEPRLEMTETVPALAPDGRMIFHASCWCGTSLLATWADVVGEPEVARALSAR